MQTSSETEWRYVTVEDERLVICEKYEEPEGAITCPWWHDYPFRSKRSKEVNWYWKTGFDKLSEFNDSHPVSKSEFAEITKKCRPLMVAAEGVARRYIEKNAEIGAVKKAIKQFLVKFRKEIALANSH